MAYNLNDYADLLRLTTDKNYSNEKFIKVKKQNHLFVLKYDKSKLSNENINSLGLFRSVIVDDKGNILCFAPPKSINFDIFSQSNNYDDCIVQHFPEGTMINLFYDKHLDDWQITSRSTIGAKCNFNMDSKITYRYMFLDAMNHKGIEFEHFDKKYCYSFVLQHPKNRIVCPINEPNIILTHRYEISDNIVKLHQDGNGLFDDKLIEKTLITSNNKPQKFSRLSQHHIKDTNFISCFNYNGNSWNDLIKHFFSDNLSYQFQGIVIYNKKGERTKIRNATYEKIKHLKGNSPKLQYQYYHLRQQGVVKDFLKYYPENKEEFSEFRRELHKWTNQLYQNYINCFIHKEKQLKSYPYNFKTHMFKVHEIYLNNLKHENKFVNRGVIIEYVNNLPPPRLMYSVNHNKKQFDKDQKIVTSDLKVLMKSEI